MDLCSNPPHNPSHNIRHAQKRAMASLAVLNTHLDPAALDRIDHHLLHVRDQSRVVLAPDVRHRDSGLAVFAAVGLVFHGSELCGFRVDDELLRPVLCVFGGEVVVEEWGWVGDCEQVLVVLFLGV